MNAVEPEARFDVFLSYHSADRPWVERLRTALEEKGLKVWLDVDRILPGDIFPEALERGLEASRAVAFIVSSTSLESKWIKEEYYNALALSNDVNRDLRLVPVLLEGDSVPGFLRVRNWVDFREPAAFAEGVERLHAGIQGGAESHPLPRPRATSGSKMTELTYLDGCLQRESTTVRQCQRVRLAAPMLGIAVFAALAIAYRQMDAATGTLAGIGSPLVTGLIGWGVTAREMARSRLKTDRLACLRDGIELCMSQTGEGCPKLLAEFWRVVHISAGADSA